MKEGGGRGCSLPKEIDAPRSFNEVEIAKYSMKTQIEKDIESNLDLSLHRYYEQNYKIHD